MLNHGRRVPPEVLAWGEPFSVVPGPDEPFGHSEGGFGFQRLQRFGGTEILRDKMDKQGLIQRLRDKEDARVERKTEGYGPGDFRKAIVAFANSLPEGHTAILFVGVRDDGTVVGVKNTDSLQKRVNKAMADCYPPIRPSPVMTVLQVEKVDVLAIEISRSENRPHFAGPAYVRRGSESVPASEELFKGMLTAHCGKAGAIQKLKGEVVTVEFIGRPLGTHRENSTYHAEPECLITDCTPHSVTFMHNGQKFSEPLENVSLAEDVKKHRQYKLIIGPR